MDFHKNLKNKCKMKLYINFPFVIVSFPKKLGLISLRLDTIAGCLASILYFICIVGTNHTQFICMRNLIDKKSWKSKELSPISLDQFSKLNTRLS